MFLHKRIFETGGSLAQTEFPTLITISEDSYCVQYDVKNSTIVGGLKIEVTLQLFNF